MTPVLSTELSERELYLIGSIVSQWGFLEAEIFEQTLLSFDDAEELPASMNNSQFTNVLKLWKERVIGRQDDERKTVLEAQYDKIVALSDYRQAIVHSRWEWRPDAPDNVTAVRVHKKDIRRITFSSDDLLDFSTSLGQIRYWVKYPGGMEDRAAELSMTGGYISRVGWDLLTGRRSLDDFLPK